MAPRLVSSRLWQDNGGIDFDDIIITDVAEADVFVAKWKAAESDDDDDDDEDEEEKAAKEEMSKNPAFLHRNIDTRNMSNVVVSPHRCVRCGS